MPRPNRKKAGKTPAAGEPGAEGAKVEAESTIKEESGLTEEEVKEMIRDVFMVLEIGQDGKFSDVTSAHREYIEGIQNKLQKGKRLNAIKLDVS